MPNLLAMSFEGELAPSFDLRCLHPGGTPPDGWGLGYYPGGEPSAAVLKEPAPPHGSIRSELVKAWEHLEASLFVLHIRTATWGALSDANTQPFHRAWGRREWLFAHAGSLRHRPALRPSDPFEPVGSTDTERVFCDLLNRVSERGWRTLGEVDPPLLREWLASLNQLGNLSVVITDGHDLAIYADQEAGNGLYVHEPRPPWERLVYDDADLEVDLTRRGVKSRKGVIVASNPLRVNGDTVSWRRLEPGSLLLVRNGAVRAEVGPTGADPQLGLPGTTRRALQRPPRGQSKRLRVLHRTVYRYTNPVEKSTHLFRLTPMHDRLQEVISNEVSISVDGQTRDYDDVFGNHVRRVSVEVPYTELTVEARSEVECLDVDPLSYNPLRNRTEIPLVWMPWHRQILQPFLMPPELPESELLELSDYAMSFVERNDYDLLDTLLDLNSTIFEDYRYLQGSTTLATTPFEVYVNRHGVCQDFTNLFICLARLLGVPARYVCGYLYTGPKNPNQRQAEASHAWTQVYLPEVGWKGLDPTNGVLTQTDHVRVAVGRLYRDATPTSGTIYGGGGGETLEVEVVVEPV